MSLVRIFFLSVFTSIVLSAASASAEISEEKIEYTSDGTTLIGYFYSDPKIKGNAPAVLIFSDWLGVGDFAKERAKELVAQGYRAFVADIYGEGKTAANSDEAMEISTRFKSDRPLTRERAKAAFYTLQKQPGVDGKRIGSIGFCFGGMVGLELARAGVPVSATVSFHGTLNTPNPTMAKNITGEVLALHGADDPFVPVEELRAFEEEMRSANVTWELIEYGGAVHAFTNPAVGYDTSSGAAYQERATKRAYTAMNSFFAHVFGE